MDDQTAVWYVSYGSNLASARFDCYLRGGVPDGGSRHYEGCRDQTAPQAKQPVFIAGGIYFARYSPNWGGGIAFLDPARPGTVPAAAYLIKAGQLSDVCAQEMRRQIGEVAVPVAEIVARGSHRVGDGHYDNLLYLGDRQDAPMITFTAPRRLRPATAPSPPYLAMITAGLCETHGWNPERAQRYLLSA